jgi:serine/threonine protein kinase/tetratricopeptide (TPR) repeat protein
MKRCAQCGAELDARSPAGLCPACLMLEALETQATGPGATAPAPAGASWEGDRFGAYRILRLIGEGGMGSVYLAEQTHPIQRQVALKVVKLGMDTRQVVARFESERQALALMDHPNIAHVYEAGTSEGGRPYFVMEYVDGVPITQYCDQHLLNTRERLELFGPVCLALQHAHQKGVIHRDIKPSNVLVTELDRKPVPKVIDFGIAKATDQRLAEYSAFTLMGHFAGTPEYMSPEQADLSSQDIDTTTDVYSLGVLLYELLAGALPFDGRWLREAGMAELLRIIREVDAPTPSDKLTTLGDMATEVARCRRTDPATLRRQLAGDLNWIVMKSLEKDRRRRYPSVSELAADIHRHLEDHPVLAGPPSKLYRARKFVRRHRAAVSAGLIIAASLVAGMIGVGWEARIAEMRRRDAEVQRARANAQAAQAGLERNRADDKARESDEQRREAEQLFGGVRDLANSMIFDVADEIAELQGATAAREKLVKKAVEYLDRLSNDPRATPALKMELAEAYLKIGDLQGRPGRASMDDPRGAAESYRRSIALLEPLAKADPANPKLKHLLIQAYLRRGKLLHLPHDGGPADLARALALAEEGVAAEPKSAEARHDLALSLRYDQFWTPELAAIPSGAQVDPKRAEEIVLKIRSLLEDLLREKGANPELRRDLAMNYGAQAAIVASSDNQRALQLRGTALKKLESLSREFPFNAQYRRDEAGARHAVARALTSANRTSEAIEFSRTAISLQQQLIDDDPRNAELRSTLLRFRAGLATMLNETGKHEEAMNLYRQALAGLDQLVAERPSNPQFRYERALLNYTIGYREGDSRVALDYMRKAQLEWEKLLRQHPGERQYGWQLAFSHFGIGSRLFDRGDRVGGLASYRRCLATFERIAAGKPPGDPAWGQVGNGHRFVARGLLVLGDQAGAAEEERKAIALFERVIAADPTSLYRSNVTSAYLGLAGVFATTRNWAAVIENASKVLTFFESEYAKDPSVSGRLDALALTLRRLAAAYAGQGDFTRVLQIRRRLVELRKKFAALSPLDPRRARLVAEELGELASDLEHTGDRQGCLEATLQAIAILDRFLPMKLAAISSHQSFANAYQQHIQQLDSIHEIPSLVAVSRRVLALWEDLYAADRNDEVNRDRLDAAHRAMGFYLQRLGNFDESLEHYQRSVELQPVVTSEVVSKWRAAADGQERTAILRGRLGDSAAMEQGLRKALEFDQHGRTLAEKAWKNSPGGVAAVRDLYYTEIVMMRAFLRLGDRQQALECGRKAVFHLAVLTAAKDPSVTSEEDSVRPDVVLLAWQLAGDRADYTGILDPAAATPRIIAYYLAHGFRHLGTSLAFDALWQDSMDAYRKSVEMFEALLREDPRNKDYRFSLSLAERNIGQAYLSNAARAGAQMRDLDHARSHFERAHTLARELQAQGLLPEDYVYLPGSLASEIAACDAPAQAKRLN